MLVGGLAALALLAGCDQQAVAGRAVPVQAPERSLSTTAPAPTTSGRQPSPSPTSTSATTGARGLPSPEAAAAAVLDSFNTKNVPGLAAIACTAPSQSEIAQLQRTWDAAGAYRASLPTPPQVHGDEAVLTVHVEGSGGSKDTPLRIRKVAGKWCFVG